jgi:two-component system, NtrC family, response regulator HydG
MKPRLTRLSQNQPEDVLLSANDLTIGRDSSSGLRLDDPTVSAHHCRIERDNDDFVVVDRDSTNGTFVNGRAVSRVRLQEGDEILIGSTRFQFMINDEPLTPRGIRIEEFSGTDIESGDTTRLSPADSMNLRLAQHITVLLQLSTEINQIDESQKLQESLLERIFDVVPAEDGVILLGTDIRNLFASYPIQRQRGHSSKEIRVSRTIVEHVFSSGESMLRNDLDVTASTESIAAAGIHSVLCVPLTVRNTPIGVLYLTTRNPMETFDRPHLQLVTAIAGIAAVALEHARYVEWLENQNRQLAHEISIRHDMIGASPKMKKVYEAISLLAPTDSPVLILGESGTGKELAARAIHNNSARRNGPFVAVNCGAITETLFASALFGHVKGAFTGADRDQKGFIEEADGGTLFLDELADLPLHCQAALLRVLEDQRIRRVGSMREISVDIRLVSATNRSLKDQIQGGKFRSDLYYRMGLPLEMPPLRERIDDIPALVSFFIQKHKHSTHREIGATPPNTMRVLQEYSWPGNVRELSGVIRWAVVFGKSDRIRVEDLPQEISQRKTGGASPVTRLDEAMESFERQFILRALQETRGNVVEAAALLARAPNYLQRRISQLDLREELDKIREDR